MIILDRNSRKPLYLQIYEHIRNEIIEGELKEGHRLSATRRQAENLGVSRNTVEQAYMQLCSEGYLENRRGSGYYVSYVDLSLAGNNSISEKKPDFHRERTEQRRYQYDMRYGNCHMADFPFSRWKRAMERALTGMAEGKLTMYGDHCGDWQLRSYLADYLERSRGVMCSPDQIVIGSGTQFFISILCQLLKPEFCAMEEPGFDGARYVFQNHGVKTIPIHITETGIDLQVLQALKPQTVYVTPSHQFPMGIVMPIQSRIELLQLAQQENFYIIEDDYDSVFRYTAKAIPAMQGLDQWGRVIYLGSVSKVLAPSLRLAYMVLPAALKTKYDMWFSQYHNTASLVLQETLRVFMEEGNWERHIRKICLANRRKHDILSAQLEKGLGKNFSVFGKGAGLHLIIESKVLTSEEMVVRNEKKGVKVYPMERYFALGSSRNLVMAGFGGIRLKEIQEAAERITEALENWS